MKQTDIKNDLLKQLELQGKFGNYYIDLVNDYMSYWKMKKDLLLDIKKRGLHYVTRTGNGFETTKPNESVQNVIKVTNTMLKILDDLGLKNPIEDDGDNEEDYM